MLISWTSTNYLAQIRIGVMAVVENAAHITNDFRAECPVVFFVHFDGGAQPESVNIPDIKVVFL
jgi:hypothetical protein